MEKVRVPGLLAGTGRTIVTRRHRKLALAVLTLATVRLALELAASMLTGIHDELIQA